MAGKDTHELRIDRTTELPRTAAVRQTKRVVVLVIGSTLIAAGLVLIVLPGPFTIPLLLLGLTVLSWEFRWAKRALFKAKMKARELRDRSRHHHIR